MNHSNIMLIISASIFIMQGCSNKEDERPYSTVCQTDFREFPDVPGWSASSYVLPPTISDVSGFYFTSINEGFLYGSNGIWKTVDQGENWMKVYSTSDGGSTWAEGLVSINFYLRNSAFVNRNLGFVIVNDHDNTIMKLSQ